MDKQPGNLLPDWVPEGVNRYLEHTETGRSIRDLARGAGCHASTILRQIRKVEGLRDDPLVDLTLSALAILFVSPSGVKDPSPADLPDLPDTESLEREAVRVMRRLCETGALLAFAEEMPKAVVVRDGANGASTRTAVVERMEAGAMALTGWIARTSGGRINRYHITTAGRAALGQMLARQENTARRLNETGFAEAQLPFSGPSAVREQGAMGQGGDIPRRRMRYSMAESPLIALARRKDRDGNLFLSDELVRAGERLREDFELAQIDEPGSQRLTIGSATVRYCETPRRSKPGTGVARERVQRALEDLGPGLGDVALRCCCFLEGLETAERQMGWSARSGKIVLRIALQRLHRHYEELSARDQMIG
ncbi:MAG: DUF6456 domain-containing protein [Rhodobacteraceae bacterium]|nr:DUF6456 domain-containing protein [Paracoccaceae bacterium]